MKRKIALVMPMVLMVLSLASCTAKRVDENTESGPPPTDAGEVKEDYSQSTAKAVGEYEMYDPYIPYDPGYYDSFNYEGYEKALKIHAYHHGGSYYDSAACDAAY